MKTFNNSNFPRAIEDFTLLRKKWEVDKADWILNLLVAVFFSMQFNKPAMLFEKTKKPQTKGN